MPILAPFRGIRYHPEKAGDLDQVITEPYDKITPPMQESYYQRGEFNFVRLILNREENPYEASRSTCEKWLADGVLVKDRVPAIYPYRQVFTTNGRTRIRRGITCLCRLEPLEGGRVLPHERTLTKPKEDRLNLMRTTRKQFEQVFMLYSDEKGEITRLLAPIWKWIPDLDATDEHGTRHCLWTVTDDATIHTLRNLMRPKTFVIADGHHRYETTLSYRDEMRKKLGPSNGCEAFNYRLVTCVNLDDPALTILPTHRVLSNLPGFNMNDFLTKAQKYFSLDARIPLDQIPQQISAPSVRRGQPVHGFIAYAGGERAHILTLRPSAGIARLFPKERSADYRGLDVAILHAVIIEHLLEVPPEQVENYVGYERDWKGAVARVEKGTAQLALMIRPPRSEQVSRVAENWELMPQKSTDFHPKLISGMVFLDVDERERID
jgi:uncharacterized protein (DUF1015 family)